MMLLPNKKKEKKIFLKKDLIDSVIDEKKPFRTFDDFWWEDKMFSERDSVLTVEASKTF